MAQSLQFRVDEGSAGQRLDEFLAARLVRLSRMRIAGLCERGACAVNGTAGRAGRRLCAGDVVEVAEAALSDETPNSMTPERLPLEVVFEDEHIVVVNKRSGVLVHPSLGVKSGTLLNALAYHLNRDTRQFVRPGLVHRLDRDTSGLLVVARTQAALSRLTQHFQRRLVWKLYLAVLGGRVRADEMTIDAPVGRVEGARPQWRVTEEGRHAETRLRVLERRGRRTLVELEPLTGRTNQLRIHCAHAGHAVVGDSLYGGEAHARLCLHASQLAFRHPATNEPLEFSSPLPPEVAAALGD
jgi:23S rRNA pseudouridine1911/1915/1917 synthase